jgi:hypothetical protein
MSDKYRLPVTICEHCGATKEPNYYTSSLDGEFYWYYEHVAPMSCIRYLRSLIDDIGSRRIV